MHDTLDTDMWNPARSIVSSLFFKDKIEIYEVVHTEDDLGEDIESLELVGSYDCNIQNGMNQYSGTETAMLNPQQRRISLSKGVALDYDKTYQVRVVNARIAYNSSEYWDVDGWVEGQISTVLTVSRSF